MKIVDAVTRKQICYVSAYQTYRRYGGPEEGGWYYKAYQFMGSAPFLAEAVEEFYVVDDPMNNHDIRFGTYEEDGDVIASQYGSIIPSAGEGQLTILKDYMRKLYDDNDVELVIEARHMEREGWVMRYC